MIIDFHTHAFPDRLAPAAIHSLEKAGNIRAHTDGTVNGLLQSMKAAGIERSVLCTIATQPEQFSKIMAWAKTIRSEKIIPIPSIHPDDESVDLHIELICKEGFRGVKMHPFYQNFSLDDKRMLPIYQALSDAGLFLVVHTGFDIAYPRIRRASPQKILEVHTAFPRLRFIATHLGGWDMWDEVESFLIGRDIHIETSFSLGALSRKQARRMLLNHPEDYLLFGSDSPWDDQRICIEQITALDLGEKREEKLFAINGSNLLEASSAF